jgi:purine-nucleoside phosphorylase
MPLHIHARPSEVAPIALLVGDPARAQRIAARLSDARLYSSNRGLLGFTGTHGGQRLSVQTTGMGGPSAAIVLEELADLGVITAIRLGTCGAVSRRVEVLDLVVATAAVPLDGTTRQYLDGEPFAPVADFDVTRALVDARSSVERPVHTGLCMTQDAFYRQSTDHHTWAARGVLGIEMEAAAVFTVALHRGLRAGAAFLVVDRVGERDSWATEADVAAGTEDLIALGLDAVTRL